MHGRKKNEKNMPKEGMHACFKKFLVNNLCHKIAQQENGEDVNLWQAYKKYSELKWNKTSTLLEDPVEATNIDNTESHFLDFMLLAEKDNIPWFLVSRQCGLSDSNLQRCINQFKQRYMYVSLPNNQRVDLGILEHLIQVNKYQLNNRLPHSKPILTMHTARLMRQLYVLHQKHPHLVPYKLDDDVQQFKDILWNWFQEKYTTVGEGIGYPRRQLLEEANEMITKTFGANKLMYCHDPSWRYLLQKIGIDDTQQKGSYLRLQVWKKGAGGIFVPNKRRSSGPGGDFTYAKRKKQRLALRPETAKEKDTARKNRENKSKKRRANL